MERLQKVIAQAGVCSRRKAEQLIVEGKVKVNGSVVDELGYKVDFTDRVEVNGKKLKVERKEYFILNKPRSVISSTNDEHDRRTVIDLVPAKTRVFPIGRLDYDTTGLIILTNDGEFANLMMHPSSGVNKTYLAVVEGLANNQQIVKLENGVTIDGYITKPAKARILEKDAKKNTSKVRITISEGRNHQVKKMFSEVGLEVKKLHRERYSELDLGNLQVGDYRRLKNDEVEDLMRIVKAKKKKK